MPDSSRDTLTAISIQKKQKRSIVSTMSAFAPLKAALPSRISYATLMPDFLPAKTLTYLQFAFSHTSQCLF
jgi:hypothetical protein